MTVSSTRRRRTAAGSKGRKQASPPPPPPPPAAPANRGGGATTMVSSSSSSSSDSYSTSSSSALSSSAASASASDAAPSSVDNEDGRGPAPDRAEARRARTGAGADGGGGGGGGSRLFRPHRTVGLVTSSQPFDLRTHGGAASSGGGTATLVTVPVMDRFHVYRTDKLAPVLVGDSLPPSSSGGGVRGSSSGKRSGGGGGGGSNEFMTRVVSDASLGVTVAVHGPREGNSSCFGRCRRPRNVALYRRTKVLRTLSVFDRSRGRWGIVDVVDLGKVKVDMGGEKEGREENALLLALICARQADADEDEDGDEGRAEGVEVVGDHGSDSESSSDDEEESKGSMEGAEADGDGDGNNDGSSYPNEPEPRGQVILLQVTRTRLRIRKRTPLAAAPTFAPGVAVHPHTYVNKIVLGSAVDERMVLLNVRSGRVVHEFECLRRAGIDKGNKGTAGRITVLEQSPAVDTIAVGTSLGDVHLVNLRHDVRLFTLRHCARRALSSGGQQRPVSITALSFRTDGSAARYGIAPLAVGRVDGTVSVWDLSPRDDEGGFGGDGGDDQRRTLLCTMENVHPGGVSHLAYLPQEPVLLTAGTRSNSLIMHVFDSPDHSGRVLRSRVGHSGPPSLVRYLHPGGAGGAGGGILANAADGTDASSCQILSCGGDGDRTLRVFSTARSVLDREYSQGRGLERRARDLGLTGGRADLLLGEIVGLATCEAKTRDWGDLVTIHRDHAMAYVWSTRRGAQCGPVLRQPGWNVSAMKVPPPADCWATAVCMSACGNFCLVGTRGGVIYRYNVQSGMPRGSYPRDATADVGDPDGSGRKGRGGSGEAGSVARTVRTLERKMKVERIAADYDDDDYGTTGTRVAKARAEQRRKAKLMLARHSGAAVTGIAVDALNRTVLSVGADAKLILWSFVTHAPHKKSPIMLPSPATKLRHVRDSDLSALAMEDYSVVLFDCSALSIVRRFGTPPTPSPSSIQPPLLSSGPPGGGHHDTASPFPPRHTGPITDLAFGSDGRRLFTSSLDGTIRVWDVPTSTCVDWMAFATPPTSLTLSPTGEFLATSHVGKVGIGLWCDRSFFQTVHLDGARPPTVPARMDDPCPLAEEEEEEDDGRRRMEEYAALAERELAAVSAEGGEGATDEDNGGGLASASSKGGAPPKAKSDGLITLSGLPAGHWKNLFHLELVKERNKPREAPKKPEKAPFFLQWRGGGNDGGAMGTAPLAESTEGASGDAAAAKEQDEWDAAWSDEEVEKMAATEEVEAAAAIAGEDGKDKTLKRQAGGGGQDDAKTNAEGAYSGTSSFVAWEGTLSAGKRRKVTHHRSHLASLLGQCLETSSSSSGSCELAYDAVTRYVSTLGPSAIDVALSTLCHGMHDLDEGLHLLHLASLWLLEACSSRQSYEAVNAYLHRFLHLHSNVIAGINDQVQRNDVNAKADADGSKAQQEDQTQQQRAEVLDTIAELRTAQRQASERLKGKMQHTLCLLRHFSRMV